MEQSDLNLKRNTLGQTATRLPVKYIEKTALEEPLVDSQLHSTDECTKLDLNELFSTVQHVRMSL